jgi:hypothetical protein
MLGTFCRGGLSGSTCRWRIFVSMAVGSALACCQSTAFSQDVHELPWSQVSLVGMHLSLISPKAPGHSLELRFSEKYVAIDVCDHDYCTGPVSVWRIEDNRLKIGYGPSDGDALVGFSTSRLLLRDKAGTVFTYAIEHP